MDDMTGACLSLVRTESADNGQRNADTGVRQDNAQPDVVVERVHEREDAWFLLLWLLDHNADAEIHERLGEVDVMLAFRCDRQRRYSYVRLLHTRHRHNNNNYNNNNN